ncbi:MAG: DegT/DnrJ/EryC1/StrS family aminotransferase [Deltaproteobacteria bacterium]|nr:DegT/DnrJ/EryC1/StrS family aminotransferase [Deltaproteobacteria bacterium]MBI2363470.1 DegT/DnrJ/EryC1/StrS family aminotransferase [Deltaproteobacteria bacterium]
MTNSSRKLPRARSRDSPPRSKPVSSLQPFKIPIVDLRAQFAGIRSEIDEAIDEVLESQQFILGPTVKRFEKQMAAYLGCEHAVGVASGSDALLLALMALEVGPGDAVLVTPFTFFSTVSSITRLGATPLFVDIDPDNYLLSAKATAAFLDERGRRESAQTLDAKTGLRLKALLPVHLFGQCCAMTEFTALAEKYHLRIVEDVAQACGARATVAGHLKFAGAIGDLGCFSFFPSKTLGGFGDGGLVTTGDGELAAKLRMLRRHGESTKYHHQVTGINSRLDSLQAAVLAVKQRHLEQWCQARIERAKNYHRLFTETGLLEENILRIPPQTTNRSHIFNNYIITVRRRDELKQCLAEQGIQSEVYYPVPLHLQACFAALGYKKGDFPQAELAAKEVLALPLYPELTSAQQESVVEAIEQFYGA